MADTPNKEDKREELIEQIGSLTVGEELRKVIASQLTDVTSKLFDIIGNPKTKADEVHPQRLELCRVALKNIEAAIKSRDQRIDLEARIDEQSKTTYCQYESGDIEMRFQEDSHPYMKQDERIQYLESELTALKAPKEE